MSMCRDVSPLVGDFADAGLHGDVAGLATQRVRLQLRGGGVCRDIGLPFYWFDILEADSADVVGELTFIPEADVRRLGTLGHVGGFMNPGARGRDLFPEALAAVAPLARRHGLAELIVSMPSDNEMAIRAAEGMRLRPVETTGGHRQFCLSLTERTPNSAAPRDSV